MTRLETEIREQPAALAAALDGTADAVAEVVRRVRARGPLEHVVIAARGTSDNAARYAQYLFGARLGVPVALAAPSLVTMYGRPAPPGGARDLVVAISQSGQSPDIVGVVASARSAGAPTVAITNDPASPLAQAADVVLDLGVGPERSVAATKTYTASLAVVAALVLALAADQAGIAELRAGGPEAAAAAIELAFGAVPALDGHAAARHVVAVGRGYNYATAMEIALKVRELTATVAEGFSPPDLLHGPIAAVAPGTPVLVVAPPGAVRTSVLEAADVLRARGATTLTIAEGAAALPLPAGLPEWLSPLAAVIPGQVLALRWAQVGGHPVDTPPGLRKVTVTR